MKYRAATSRRREQQGGFILLVVFLMAAAIALTLYTQLPRIAFESEREKEQILIERGEQYVRAIQLYQQDNNGQWPQSIDDLERGRNKRYLRRRYIDPYTGKDDWRIIHTNGVQLTDSLVEKVTTDASGNPTTGSTTAAAPQPNQEQQVNSAVLARPSDTTLPGAQQFNVINPAGANPGGQNPAQPQQLQPGGVTFGVPGVGLPPGVQLPGNVQTSAGPGAQPGGFQPQFPGQQFAGQQPPPGVQTTNPGGFQPQFPGQQFPGQVQVVPNLNPGQTLSPGQAPPGFAFGPNGQLLPAPVTAPLPGQTGGQATAGNAGVDAITRLLTTPRTPPAGVSVPTNNAAGGGGIAGVASKHTGPSIKVYNERQKYEEWEFVYTPRQNTAAVGVGGATPGGPGGPGGNGPGQTGQGRGQQPGQGPQQGGFSGTGFGQTGFGQTGFGQGGTQPAGGGRGGGANPAPGGVGAAGSGAGRGR